MKWVESSVRGTESATKMSLTLATSAPLRRRDFFDWSLVSARLEKHQSAIESEWTVDMRYKRWTSRMAWEAADRALSRKYPALCNFLRLGNSLIQLLRHASPLHWDPGNIVEEAFLFVIDTVHPPRYPMDRRNDILRAVFDIKSISAVIIEIDILDVCAEAAPSLDVLRHLPLLERWYKDALRRYSMSTSSRWTSDITLESPGNEHQIAFYRDILRRTHEKCALAAVTPEGTYPDLTQDLSLSRNPCGHGASCDVYLATWNLRDGTAKMVAVKAFRIPDQGPSNYITKLAKRMKDELDIWSLLEHPHILPLHGMHWIGGAPGLVTPWCENGDLSQYVKDLHGPARLAIALRLMEQVALGLEYLHTRSPAIVHGDLKGANILISEDGQALICDFGLAAMEAAAAETSFMFLSGTSAKGTYRWMAHEIVLYDDARLTRESDIWAFGCVLLEVLSGRVPYYEKTEAVQVILAISQGEIPTRPPGIHDRVWKFMLHCWQLVPSARPCAGCILGDIREFLESDELERWMSGQITDASPV